MARHGKVIKLISDQIWNSAQSWHREVVQKIGADTFRFKIRANAYDFQSYATAEVWKENSWSKIHTIPGEKLKTNTSYVEVNVKSERFAADLAELQRVALAVTSG